MARRPPPLVALVDSAAQMGGVEFSTLYLAEQLDRARFRCVVICPAEGDLPRCCRERGIAVRVVPRPRVFSTSLRIRGRTIVNPLAWVANGTGFVLAARWLAGSLRHQQVDLVCTKGLPAHFYGGLAARWMGSPCVWHVQDLVSPRAGGLYARILGSAAAILARQVIADGSTIRAQLATYLPPGRVVMIHNGVDTAAFSPKVDGRGVRAAWGVAENEVLVGNVARLTPWKGQIYLLRAFAEIQADFPSAKLVLVGTPVFDTDAYDRELRQLVAELDLQSRVIFAGYRWDLPQVLAAIDLFVHASIEKDTSPLAVVSAMAAGKAILTTDVGGVAELFAPGESIQVRPADVAALAAGLRHALGDPAMRVVLGQAARRKAESALSLPQFARRCEAVFARALTSNSRAPRRVIRPDGSGS
ncbi:MAG TPA: glycosyltransferase family 4 protein [Chloroflexia bacterium]|nr:glycosyltransferase family 4 protein [Chloroflexia bacterium]